MLADSVIDELVDLLFKPEEYVAVTAYQFRIEVLQYFDKLAIKDLKQLSFTFLDCIRFLNKLVEPPIELVPLLDD